MAKIIRLSDKMDRYLSPTEFLQDSIRHFEAEGITTLLIAGKNADGFVMTGYYECDFGTRQELVGHIQCDIINQMIEANE